MPEEWKDDGDRDDFEIIHPKEDRAPPQKTDPLSEILRGLPRELDMRRDSQQTHALFLEELSRQFDRKKRRKPPEPNHDAETHTHHARETEVETGLRNRRYTQVLDSLASSGNTDSTDNRKSRTQKLEEMVQQMGDAGLINSWNAKKKRQADALAVRTRSSATMLNAAINVREFTDDSRSYGLWLDGVAPPEEKKRGSLDTERQEPAEKGGEPREPRFREDSAANFLNSVTSQILDEFDDSKDEHEGPKELGIEDSEDKLLGAVSQQIVEEFTDSRSPRSPSEGQSSDGPRGGQRFREKSALKFLEALSKQLRPEFKNRRSDPSSKTSKGDGEPRFRENSAIDFLNALRDQILQTGRDSPPPEASISTDREAQSEIEYEIEYEIPGSIDSNVQSETQFEVDTVRDDDDVQPETEHAIPSSSDQNVQSEMESGVDTVRDDDDVQPETEDAIPSSSDQNDQSEQVYE